MHQSDAETACGVGYQLKLESTETASIQYVLKASSANGDTYTATESEHVVENAVCNNSSDGDGPDGATVGTVDISGSGNANGSDTVTLNDPNSYPPADSTSVGLSEQGTSFAATASKSGLLADDDCAGMGVFGSQLVSYFPKPDANGAINGVGTYASVNVDTCDGDDDRLQAQGAPTAALTPAPVTCDPSTLPSKLPKASNRTVDPTVGITEGDTLGATAPGSSITRWNLVSQTFGTGSWGFLWNGDGTFSLDPPQTATVKFRYTVTAANGCTSAPATVTVIPSPARASLSALGDTTHSPTRVTLRAGVPAGITAGPHTTYRFSFGDHTRVATTSKPTTHHAYKKNGSYSAGVTVRVNAKHIYSTSVLITIGAKASKPKRSLAHARSVSGIGGVAVYIESATVGTNHNPSVSSDCVIKVRARVEEFGKSGITALKQRGYLHGAYAGNNFPSYQSTDYQQSSSFPDDSRNFYYDVTTYFLVEDGEWTVQIKGVGVKNNAPDPSTSTDTTELDCDADG
jgi:hypothetical protein